MANTPAARIPRQYMTAPQAHIPTAHSGGGAKAPPTPKAGPSGNNPISKAIGGNGAEVQPYQFQKPTGLPSLLLHGVLQGMSDEVTDRNQARVDAQGGKTKELMGQALNSYEAAVQAAGGNRMKGMVNWLQSADGHQALVNNVAGAVAQAHTLGIGSSDNTSLPQVTELPHGLLGVNTGAGWQVMTPKQYEAAGKKASAGEKPFSATDKQGAPLVEPDPDNPGKYRPIQVTGASAQAQPPGSPGGPPVHEGKGTIPVNFMNVISSAPSLVEGLNMMSALSGKATGLPGGFLQNMAAKYGGINDPAALWDIAKKQVELSGSRFYSGVGGGGATGFKNFVAALPSYNEAPRYNVADADMIARTVTNTTRQAVPLVEQKIGGALPAINRKELESSMGIYSSQEQWRDPWAVLQAGKGQQLSDAQLRQAWDTRKMHSPQDAQLIVQENQRRLEAAQTRQQGQPNPTGNNVPQQAPNTGAPSLPPGTAPIPSPTPSGASMPSEPAQPPGGGPDALGGVSADLKQPLPGQLPQVPNLSGEHPTEQPATPQPPRQQEMTPQEMYGGVPPQPAGPSESDKARELLKQTEPPAKEPYAPVPGQPGAGSSAEPAGAPAITGANLASATEGMVPSQPAVDAAHVVKEMGPILAQMSRQQSEGAT